MAKKTKRIAAKSRASSATRNAEAPPSSRDLSARRAKNGFGKSSASLTRKAAILELAADNERAARLRAYKRSLKAAARHQPLHGFGAAEAAAPRISQARLLAEGDSWFDFPPHADLIDWLNRQLDLRTPILNNAVAGSESREVMGVKRAERLEMLLSDSALGIDALLFSAGGNDVVGEHMHLWLNDARSVGNNPSHAINQTAFNTVLGLVETGYRHLIQIREAAIVSRDLERLPMFWHSYAYARPTGKGVCGRIGGGYYFGPWLKPSLNYKGWSTPTTASQIVQAMLSSFHDRLVQIASSTTDVHVINAQADLQPNQWNDELHPSRSGFKIVAEAWERVLRKEL